MDVKQLNSRIAVVNGVVAKLNNERQINIGRRTTLSDQLTQAIKAYQDAYGVELTEENIDSEMSKIVQEKDQEVAVLERVIQLVNEGQYEEVNRLLGVLDKSEKEESVDAVAEAGAVTSPVDAVSSPVGAVETAERPTGNLGAVERPAPVLQTKAPVAEPKPTPPPIAKPTSPSGMLSGLGVPMDFEEDDTPPARPPLSSLDMGDTVEGNGFNLGQSDDVEDSKPAPPPAIGGGKQPIKSFSAIIGGSQFRPQS